VVLLKPNKVLELDVTCGTSTNLPKHVEADDPEEIRPKPLWQELSHFPAPVALHPLAQFGSHAAIGIV
jgi:hypothetical protein